MKREDWIPFDYRDFYDVPRLILLQRPDGAFLLDSPFDEESDEYLDVFHVYRMSLASAAELRARSSWVDARLLGTLIATVPVAAVAFDPTKREAIHGALFDRYEFR
jgi:hypothetical protein